MVAKKDFVGKHHALDLPNLYVIKLMQSFKTKGYVREDFNWQWYYWFLTNEGIEHLRQYLHLPERIVPLTLQKPTTAPRPATERAPRAARPPRGPEEEKKVGAPSSDFKPAFRGGFGRGAPRGGRDSTYRREGGPSRGGFGRGAQQQ